MNFSSSFKATARRIYSVSFDNSNVIENQLKLRELLNNVENNTITDKYNGVPIDKEDVQIVIGALDELVKYYCAANVIYSIPSKLKLYELTKEIRDYDEKKNKNGLKSEIIKDMFDSKNLTKAKSNKKSREDLIELKSKERAFDIINKHVNHRK